MGLAGTLGEKIFVLHRLLKISIGKKRPVFETGLAQVRGYDRRLCSIGESMAKQGVE